MCLRPANYAQFGRILKKDGVLIASARRGRYRAREAAGGRLAAYDGACFISRTRI